MRVGTLNSQRQKSRLPVARVLRLGADDDSSGERDGPFPSTFLALITCLTRTGNRFSGTIQLKRAREGAERSEAPTWSLSGRLLPYWMLEALVFICKIRDCNSRRKMPIHPWRDVKHLYFEILFFRASTNNNEQLLIYYYYHSSATAAGLELELFFCNERKTAAS